MASAFGVISGKSFVGPISRNISCTFTSRIFIHLGLTFWSLNHFEFVFVCQFSLVSQLCPTLCDPMNRSTPGFPFHLHLPEFTQTPVHWVRDAIQPSHPRSSPSPPAPNPYQHQGLFQWVNSSHEVAKVLEFQPQHQSFMHTHSL